MNFSISCLLSHVYHFAIENVLVRISVSCSPVPSTKVHQAGKEGPARNRPEDQSSFYHYEKPSRLSKCKQVLLWRAMRPLIVKFSNKYRNQMYGSCEIIDRGPTDLDRNITSPSRRAKLFRFWLKWSATFICRFNLRNETLTRATWSLELACNSGSHSKIEN